MRVYYIVLVNYETQKYGVVGIYSTKELWEQALESLNPHEDEEIDTGEIDLDSTNDFEALRDSLSPL